MGRYTTTNLRLPSSTYEELRYEASRRRTSVAAVVREAVAQYLGQGGKAADIPFGEDPLDRLAGLVTGGASDESVNHDHYLYGWPKETTGETARGHGSAARLMKKDQHHHAAVAFVRSTPRPGSC
jgi:predicted DNA-binding protein